MLPEKPQGADEVVSTIGVWITPYILIANLLISDSTSHVDHVWMQWGQPLTLPGVAAKREESSTRNQNFTRKGTLGRQKANFESRQNRHLRSS